MSAAPLWTLPLAVRCYLIVLVTGMLGLLSSPRGVALAAVLGCAAFAVWACICRNLQIGMRDFSEAPGAVGYTSFWPEPFFMLGMLLYGWRERIDINGLTALAFDDGVSGVSRHGRRQPLFYLAFVYGVLWVGTTPLLRRFVPRHDYSYGIYLYGFMVQQCVANIAPQLGHVTSLLVAAPLILLCAALSWHFVERPVLTCVARAAPGSRRQAAWRLGDRMVR